MHVVSVRFEICRRFQVKIDRAYSLPPRQRGISWFRASLFKPPFPFVRRGEKCYRSGEIALPSLQTPAAKRPGFPCARRKLAKWFRGESGLIPRERETCASGFSPATTESKINHDIGFRPILRYYARTLYCPTKTIRHDRLSRVCAAQLFSLRQKMLLLTRRCNAGMKQVENVPRVSSEIIL